MSVEIWPSLPPEQLITAVEQTQRRELEWLLNELHETLQNLKSGLEDCYALLAPIDPGSTLVVSSHRNEIVKGHITRVGTRIVKGILTLKLRTLPNQTYTINAEHPIQIAPLTTLHALLNHSIDLLTLTLSYTYSSGATGGSEPPASPTRPTATFIAAQLRLLSQSLTEATSLLKGPQPLTASDATWVSKSCSPGHFSPQPGSNLSIQWGVQESQLVLWLRTLEPADAPVNLGMKFALAIGTTRRLEHDEAEQVFMYTYPEGATPEPQSRGNNGGGSGGPGQRNITKENVGPKDNNGEIEAQVFVREKVRVESADPALMSLGTKLAALAKTLSMARGNLATVMGEELDE
ncbi:hypothetical protein N8I77_010056 [Diaporthe amygdali]|uniref:Uncharacterized protein n=1 Tax=Phomopsis amygdali TaxID=1214568 RepID=A0AAD9S673_PHOAM|nr:hypothetical protein N8I77_010056 [Diaporthe amygdali]